MTKRVREISIKKLSDKTYELKEASFEYQLNNGEWVKKQREFFNRGNAATVLLYNKAKGTIVLNYQFRFPTLVNGNENGFMYETAAGVIGPSDKSPKEAMIRELKEETGYHLKDLKHVFTAFSTPAAVTEKIYFFIAPYTDDMKRSEGGGLAEEKEDIKVVEMPIEKAISKIASGDITDLKTITLIQYAQLKKLFG